MSEMSTLGMPPGADPNADSIGRPPSGLPPREWVKANLFNSRFNSVLTIVFGTIVAYLGFQAVRWVFFAAEWEPVQRNLTLFMQGTFPRDEQWRLTTSTIMLGAAAGIIAGTLRASARHNSEETGEPFEPSSLFDVVQRFWPLELFVIVLLLAARTFSPVLLAGSTLAVGLVLWAICSRLPALLVRASWAAALLVAHGSFQVVSGSGGRAWLGPALILAVVAYQYTDRLPLKGLTATAARWAIAVGVMVAVKLIYLLPLFDYGGVTWSKWSGMHLSLFATAVSITLAFPIGLIMALGRRSSFPAFRWLTVVYIEFIRGVPLITLLLTAQFFIGFFVSASSSLDLITRAIVAMTLFTAAYIAEIVRGGLLSVPQGQVEAGQALGLPAFKVTTLIVLPQALRAVIPAMVGQFISLFKDTSLLAIIGVIEFLGVRELVHSQQDFRIGLQEMTLAFIAFGYWSVSFTMSRESQRLERKLAVGAR